MKYDTSVHNTLHLDEVRKTNNMIVQQCKIFLSKISALGNAHEN